MGKGIV